MGSKMTSLEAKTRSELCENYAYDSSVDNAEVNSRQTSSSHVGFRGCSVLSAVSVPAEAQNRFFLLRNFMAFFLIVPGSIVSGEFIEKKHAISKS